MKLFMLGFHVSYEKKAEVKLAGIPRERRSVLLIMHDCMDKLL